VAYRFRIFTENGWKHLLKKCVGYQRWRLTESMDCRYKSTPHRVLNHSGQERLSIVLAYDPNPETQVDPKAIYGSDYSGDLEPISCGDYLQWRFNNAFAYRA
jgi:isopenicillin N synthase-like dioxygenase